MVEKERRRGYQYFTLTKYFGKLNFDMAIKILNL